MERFIEKLVNREYELDQEVCAIDNLMERDCLGGSVYEKFAGNFLDWEMRNNYIEVADFLDDMGINNLLWRAGRGVEITAEEFAYYCEFVLNIMAFVERGYEHDTSRYIRNNIDNVLERINYHYVLDGGCVHVMEKDVLVSEAADIVQDTYDLAKCIYSYNYREYKGDLNGKADILCRLYKYTETIKGQAKSYGYTKLVDDIGDLSNKLDVRHAPSPKQKIVLEGMTEAEIEEWFDELFRMCLSLIILVDYTSKRKDINELKSKLG